jgi:hypothetical protein
MTGRKNWLWASLLATVLFVPQGAFGHLLGGRTDVALADTPACGNSSHNTASGQSWACSNSADGTKYNMLCNGNLRQGPGLSYAIHGTATGSGINRYRDVFNGAAVDGGCGGPITNEWYLSSNGWVSHSITTAAM